MFLRKGREVTGEAHRPARGERRDEVRRHRTHLAPPGVLGDEQALVLAEVVGLQARRAPRRDPALDLARRQTQHRLFRDAESVNGVLIVAKPEAIEVARPSEVHHQTATRAPFEVDAGMTRAYLAQKQTVPRVVVREVLAEVVDVRLAVEVELDERNAVFLHEVVDRGVQVGARVGAREVEELGAVLRAEELGMVLHHLRAAGGGLRLDPQAELHAGRLHRLRDLREASAQPAVRTLLPVPARGDPIPLRTEPARVNHEILEPELAGLLHLLQHEVGVQLVEPAEPGVVERRVPLARIGRVPPGVELVAVEVGLVREVVGDDLRQSHRLALLQDAVEMARVHADLDDDMRLLAAAGHHRGAHLPHRVGHQVEHASALRLRVPEREHRRGAIRGAHPAAARLHARVERLPRAAAFVHPGIGLRVHLEVAALEAERVQEARRDERLVREVAHDRAAVHDTRHARRHLRLHADAVLVGRKTLVGLAHAALEEAEVGVDVPYLAGVLRFRNRRDAQHRRENCSEP